MAKSVEPFTWIRGFREPASSHVWEARNVDENNEYVYPPSKEVVTSATHNDLGINVLRTWPTIYDGTNSPHGIPEWWKPQSEVDVLICGAGPSGLEVALSLIRQGVSFRIIDKAETPLIAGRADGVQPRFLETLASWGLAKEVHEEGPLIERTAIYKDGKKLLFNPSHQSDSRYRGLHIITQGQLERIYVRDLTRHKVLVERSTILSDFSTTEEGDHPVHATIKNTASGQEERIKAKFLVGSDGAASVIRKELDIPFDGMSTDIYWGIMDCVFETDYPHAWVFGSVISSKHGGCVIIPREDGYIRLYTQLDVSKTGPISKSRSVKDPTFAESGGRVDIHSITADEVLEQANKIFAPYTLKFASSLSWFAIWKISERVARRFSSHDQRVHLVGDAAHVHSVMGAFGLNASIMDAANLAWKMGLVARNKAQFDAVMPTYNAERRAHAVRIIEVSGEYLRFVCDTDLDLAKLRLLERGDTTDSANGVVETNGVSGHAEKPVNGTHDSPKVQSNGEGPEKDLQFLGKFFKTNGHFLLGVDAPYDGSVVSPATKFSAEDSSSPPLSVRNGVRAPNPRVCFSTNETGYLYDKMMGASTFHIVLFASKMTSAVRQQLQRFGTALGPSGFYSRFGGAQMFNIVVVVQSLPFELDHLIPSTEFGELRREATIVFDDRAPDESAHTTWGVNHGTGGVAVVRPDLWVGFTTTPGDVAGLEGYFESFLKV